MSKRTVLIVDDELTLLRSLRDALRAQASEMEVLTAGRADEALELMELTEVDLVVTDLRMPGQDGLSFIATVSHKYPKTRCILMTAHGDTETRNRSLSGGAVSFIEKPFDLDKFISEVKRHLTPSGGFTGRSLVGFSLLDILQLVSMSQQSVTMTIRSGERVGSMYIEDGILIHAESDSGRAGTKAAYEIVTWSDGDIASSRGVAADCKRTMSVPLMTFLMEAAKHQDEAKRLKPVEDIRDIAAAMMEINGIAAVSIAVANSAAEIYGSGISDEYPRQAITKSMVDSYVALSDALNQSRLVGVKECSMIMADGTQALAVPILEGRFLVICCMSSPDNLEDIHAALTANRGNLVSALSEYESQFDLQGDNALDAMNLGEDLDQAFGSLDMGSDEPG